MASKKRKAQPSTGDGIAATIGDQITQSCRECAHWQEMKEKIRIAEVLERAISKFEERFRESDFKPTLAEYLKLLQMEREIEVKELEEAPKEITVTWVEPELTSTER